MEWWIRTLILGLNGLRKCPFILRVFANTSEEAMAKMLIKVKDYSLYGEILLDPNDIPHEMSAIRRK